jgi:hypothetical protein
VRIALDEEIGVETDLAEQVARATLGLGGADAMHARGKGNRILDGQAWVERGIRILEHHLHLAAHVGDADAIERADHFAIENRVADVRLNQADEQAGGRRFAATGFADDAERLALGNRKGNIVDRLHRRDLAIQDAAAHGKVFAQVRDDQQRLGRAAAVLGNRQDGGVGGHYIFTSMALRKPSLIRLAQIETMKIIAPGNAAIVGLM